MLKILVFVWVTVNCKSPSNIFGIFAKKAPSQMLGSVANTPLKLEVDFLLSRVL